MSERIALVFGATGCIGEAICCELAKNKIKLILVGKNTNKLELLDDKIKKINNKNSTLVPLDLSHSRSIDKLGSVIFEKFKKIDLLINLASFFPKLSPITHISPKDFNKIININIVSAWNIIRVFDPLLKMSNNGRVYFMVCKRKKYKEPYFTSYSLTSNAIETLIKNWRMETVNSSLSIYTYDPGPVLSNLRKNSFPGENKNKLQKPSLVAKKFVKELKNSYLE
tara:strand:+ start:649 stop:1323 length:675 start_codon:yes stop_codon:yes gene_type:complete